MKPESYENLLNRYNGERIPYQLLLETHEWGMKRTEVVRRDRSTCKKCGKLGKTKFSGILNNHYVEIRNQPDEDDVIISNEHDEHKKYRVLHVHHTYYIEKALPWEYPLEDLITLCHECHLELHQNECIPMFTSADKATKLLLTPCSRCHGAGIFPEYHYIQNGICFRCNGERYEEFIQKNLGQN